MRFFFVEQPIQIGSTYTITGSDAKHIRTVLRLKPRDHVFLFDGKGFEYEVEIMKLSAKSVDLSVINRSSSATDSSVNITVAQAFLKEKKMEALIRPLSELGINRWIPFVSERSVPRIDRKRMKGRIDRWQKIAIESLKQCRRSRPLKIEPTVSFKEVLNLGHPNDLRLIFWESETKPICQLVSQSQTQKVNEIFLMLGPEGGFTEAEVESAKNQGFLSLTLGRRILRAETATIAACALIQYLFGDLS